MRKRVREREGIGAQADRITKCWKAEQKALNWDFRNSMRKKQANNKKAGSSLKATWCNFLYFFLANSLNLAACFYCYSSCQCVPTITNANLHINAPAPAPSPSHWQWYNRLNELLINCTRHGHQGLKLRSCATIDVVVVVACNRSQLKCEEDQLWQFLAKTKLFEVAREVGEVSTHCSATSASVRKVGATWFEVVPNTESVAWAPTHTHTHTCRTQLKPSSSRKHACASLDVLDRHVVKSVESRAPTAAHAQHV